MISDEEQGIVALPRCSHPVETLSAPAYKRRTVRPDCLVEVEQSRRPLTMAYVAWIVHCAAEPARLMHGGAGMTCIKPRAPGRRQGR